MEVVAVMVTVPAATPVTTPPSTVAMLALLVVQVSVRSTWAVLKGRTTELRVTVFPTATVFRSSSCTPEGSTVSGVVGASSGTVKMAVICAPVGPTKT